MRRSWMGGWIATALCTLPLVAAAQDAAPAPEPAATVNAVWVEHEVNFTYMPLTSYYSCDGLRDKVRWILRQLGARPDFKVRSRGCIIGISRGLKAVTAELCRDSGSGRGPAPV